MIKTIYDNGRPWLIETNGELVAFYDTRYEHSNFGQFVSRYYIDTILKGTAGLCLDGGVPEWTISAAGMARVREHLRFVYLREYA
jgi:hypothetical protein